MTLQDILDAPLNVHWVTVPKKYIDDIRIALLLLGAKEKKGSTPDITHVYVDDVVKGSIMVIDAHPGVNAPRLRAYLQAHKWMENYSNGQTSATETST